jgi:hypothetical protein
MLNLILGGSAGLFGVPALVGTLFFLARIGLMLFGGVGDLHHDLTFDSGGGDVSGDVSGDASGDAGGDASGHTDSGLAFKILSIQAISAFLMGFGWGGLAAVRGFGLPALAGIAVGLATGSGMMWLLGKMLKFIGRMQSSGTLPMEAALYEEGVVYVTVPAGRAGHGSVRVVVDERMQYYSAVTEGEMLATGTAVRVTGINEDHTLTVERAVPELPAPGD